MTVVAWDGKTLAADKMSCVHGVAQTVTKVHKLRGGEIAALAGDGDGAMALLVWLNGARDPNAYPKAQETDRDATAFVVDVQGRCWVYGKTPYPQQIEDRLYAMGHGRDFALAAMHLGKSAAEAVELACRLDVFCGCGVDSLALEPAAC